MAKKKYVYFYGFGKENTEGDATMKAILGGKGANLAEMRASACPFRRSSPSPPKPAMPTSPKVRNSLPAAGIR